MGCGKTSLKKSSPTTITVIAPSNVGTNNSPLVTAVVVPIPKRVLMKPSAENFTDRVHEVELAEIIENQADDASMASGILF